jgi:hypothetical protein
LITPSAGKRKYSHHIYKRCWLSTYLGLIT